LLARLNAKVNLIAPKPGPGIPFDTPDPGVASFRQLSGARCRVLSASSVDSTSTLPTDSWRRIETVELTQIRLTASAIVERVSY